MPSVWRDDKIGVNKMENSERLSVLEEAQRLIEEAIEKIQEAMRGTRRESAVDAYIVAHLDNWAHGNNPYDDTAIPRLMEEVGKITEESECPRCGAVTEGKEGAHQCPDCGWEEEDG